MWWKLLTLFSSSLLVVNFPFVPTRPALLAFLFASEINVFLVIITCVIGTTLGVIPLYGAIFKAHETELGVKWLKNKMFKKILKKIDRNMFLIIIIINITPLPDILIGAVAGSDKYDFKKFILANMIGRIIFYTPFALGGYYFAGDIHMFEAWFTSLFV